MSYLKKNMKTKTFINNLEIHDGGFYNKKQEKYKKIIEVVEQKHNSLLRKSISVINDSLNICIHIFDNEKDIIEKIRGKRLKNLEKDNKQDILITRKIVINSVYLGNYFLVITSNVDYKNFKTMYIEKILDSIIEECESYIKIDKIGFSKYMGEAQDIDIESILNKYIDNYIEYCEDNFNEIRYYTKINQSYIEHFENILSESRGDIITHLYEISQTPYESKYSKGSILIIDRNKFNLESLNKSKNTLILKNRINLTEYKSVRKILAMAESGFVVLSDGRYIYGIINNSDHIDGVISKVKFTGNHSFIILDQYGKCIAKFKNGKPIIEEALNLEDVRVRIIKLFNTEVVKGKIKLDIDSIMKIINEIIKQSKGSMLVISNKAQEESKRLRYQSIIVEKIGLEDENIIKSISSIDGSILIDTEGKCQSIGVILDGIACKIGDNSRGARYNSAIKYIYEQTNKITGESKNHKCMAIVISEDGMIDIIDEYEISKLEKRSKLDDYEDTLDELIKEIDENEDNRELVLKRAQIYLNKGEENNALNDYNKLLEMNPKDAYIYYERGNLYAHKGEYTKALDDYNEALLNMKHTHFESIITRNTFESMIYSNRGVIYSRLENFKSALCDYDEVIKLNPKNSLAYNNRGGIHYRIENYEDSIRDFTKAIELDINFIDAYENRARTYVKLSEYENAKNDYTRLIKIDKSLMSARFMRGYINYSLNLYKSAIEDYTSAIDLNTKNLDNYYHRAHCYICEAEYDKAITDFNECIKLDDRNSKAYFNRGYCYERKGEKDKALDDYNKSIELDPEYIYAYYGMAQRLWDKKDYGKALENYNKVIELDAEFDQEIFFKRGNTYRELGKLKEAIEDYTNQINRTPKNSKVYANRSASFFEQHKYEEAKSDAAYALLIDSNDEVAIDVLRVLNSNGIS
ncbi:tetratricopeptide repeat protein [Paraclostridium bifermentans]|uniref:tetratricopeptide repeat protein n=1 Tax=Paraclostridium bifermentans TaxID=1490 RepID=UPI003D2C1B25